MDVSDDKKERVAVYIDGSNFYNYLKDKEINFPKGTKFDFKTFTDRFIFSLTGSGITRIFYILYNCYGYIIVTVLAIIVGLLNDKDYFWYGKSFNGSAV